MSNVLRYLDGVQIKRAKSAWVGRTSISGFFPVTRHFRLVLVAVQFLE